VTQRKPDTADKSYFPNLSLFIRENIPCRGCFCYFTTLVYDKCMKRITISLKDPLYDKLLKESKRQGRSFSNLINFLLSKYDESTRS